MVFLFAKLYGILYKPLTKEPHLFAKSKSLKVLFICLVVGLYFIAMRGNLGVVPLDGRHATISENAFVNTLPVNGLFSTKIAWTDRMRSRIDISMPKMLRELKFRSIEGAASSFYGFSIDSVAPEMFYTLTNENDFLEKNPPHVVFILMESMSNFYIDLHSDSCNMLGSLADVLDSCYLF